VEAELGPWSPMLHFFMKYPCKLSFCWSIFLKLAMWLPLCSSMFIWSPSNINPDFVSGHNTTLNSKLTLNMWNKKYSYLLSWPWGLVRPTLFRAFFCEVGGPFYQFNKGIDRYFHLSPSNKVWSLHLTDMMEWAEAMLVDRGSNRGEKNKVRRTRWWRQGPSYDVELFVDLH
jgi:hypothetical protein